MGETDASSLVNALGRLCRETCGSDRLLPADPTTDAQLGQTEAVELGGQFESDAALRLAEYVGNNTLRCQPGSDQIADLCEF